MKHIVYLDTDCLNSYIAQIFQGIPRATSSTQRNSQTATDSETTSNSVKAGVVGGFDVKLAAAKTQIEAILGPNEVRSEFSSSRYAQELTEKVLHDNAFDIFVDYLKERNSLVFDLSDAHVGDFVLCNFPLETLDLESMLNLLSDNTMTLIAEVTAHDAISKMDADAELKGAKVSNNRRKEVITAIKNEMSKNGYTQKIVEAMNAISPYSQFVCGDGAIVPLKKEWLRESLPEIDFKYDSDVHIVGRYTKNGNNKKESGALDPAFNNLTDVIFDMATSLYQGEERRIISPIALFFE